MSFIQLDCGIDLMLALHFDLSLCKWLLCYLNECLEGIRDRAENPSISINHNYNYNKILLLQFHTEHEIITLFQMYVISQDVGC